MVAVGLLLTDAPAKLDVMPLSQTAHIATASGDTARVKEIEAKADRAAARLWGPTDDEPQKLQQSFGGLWAVKGKTGVQK